MTCLPGKYLNPLHSCVGCPLGRFSDTTNATYCMYCPDGEYTIFNQSSSCIDIPSCGSYHYWNNASRQCVECSDPTETIAAVAWIVFTISCIGVCIRPLYNWWCSIIPMFIIAMVNTLCTGSISDISNISMGVACILCIIQTYSVCTDDRDQDRYTRF